MHGETLGDILGAAMEEAMNPKTIQFHASSHNTVHAWADIVTFHDKKISMIKEMRQLAGMGLLDAKNVIESREGFIMPTGIFNALVKSTSAGWWVTNDPYHHEYKPYRIFC